MGLVCRQIQVRQADMGMVGEQIEDENADVGLVGDQEGCVEVEMGLVRGQVGDRWAYTGNDGQQIGMDRQMLYKLGKK